MKSNYERKWFTTLYWLIAGIFIIVTYTILFLLGTGSETNVRFMLGVVGFSELFMVVLLYLLLKNYVERVYKSLEDVSDSMRSFMTDGTINEERDRLMEGDVGILYDNFDKLINMFRENENREKTEKEYLKEVMSDISHQLKTPLASMEVFLELLINDKVKTEEERKKILGEASNQVTRMEWMVLSMLKLARIEAGAVTFDKKKSKIALILDEVQGGVRYLIDSREQKLRIDCDEEIEADVDPEWLTEAVINIVKNASDYAVDSESKNKELIEINVEQNAVFTRIYIRDHGIGMSEETILHIFERFFRASSEVNPNSVGIGLSLSKSIVEGMGGKITVDSTLGEGSTFCIQLP